MYCSSQKGIYLKTSKKIFYLECKFKNNNIDANYYTKDLFNTECQLRIEKWVENSNKKVNIR